jgi:hypothetical protein
MLLSRISVADTDIANEKMRNEAIRIMHVYNASIMSIAMDYVGW